MWWFCVYLLVFSSARGDPEFVGFRGQSYQIHGKDGFIYNVISDPFVEMNTRLKFLTQGKCPAAAIQSHSSVIHHRGAHQKQITNNLVALTAEEQREISSILCFSHPGSYFSSLSIQTVTGDCIYIEAGPAETSFKTVLISLNARK